MGLASILEIVEWMLPIAMQSNFIMISTFDVHTKHIHILTFNLIIRDVTSMFYFLITCSLGIFSLESCVL